MSADGAHRARTPAPRAPHGARPRRRSLPRRPTAARANASSTAARVTTALPAAARQPLVASRSPAVVTTMRSGRAIARSTAVSRSSHAERRGEQSVERERHVVGDVVARAHDVTERGRALARRRTRCRRRDSAGSTSPAVPSRWSRSSARRAVGPLSTTTAASEAPIAASTATLVARVARRRGPRARRARRRGPRARRARPHP